MPNVRITSDSQAAALDAFTAQINVGGTGEIQFYNKDQPLNPNSIITDQILLFTLGFLSPAFFPTVDGVADANTITTGLGIAIGDCTWARIVDGNGKHIFDCDVGTVGTTIILDTVVVDIDDILGLVSFKLRHPNGA